MAAARRTTAPLAALLGVALLGIALGGCDSGGSGSPVVVGTAHRPDPTAGATLVDPEDTYYDRMALPLDALPTDLADGDRIEVVVGGSCAESFPVQCEVREVRVIG